MYSQKGAPAQKLQQDALKSNFIFQNDSDHEEVSTQDVNKLVKQEDPRKAFKQQSED